MEIWQRLEAARLTINVTLLVALILRWELREKEQATQLRTSRQRNSTGSGVKLRVKSESKGEFFLNKIHAAEQTAFDVILCPFQKLLSMFFWAKYFYLLIISPLFFSLLKSTHRM